MPFRLCNAPATFERLMERVLKGLYWNSILLYLYDIIVMSKTFAEHFKNLGEVLQRISMAGMKLSAKECAFFQRQVKYLGYLVCSTWHIYGWRTSLVPRIFMNYAAFWDYAHVIDAFCLTLRAHQEIKSLSIRCVTRKGIPDRSKIHHRQWC